MNNIKALYSNSKVYGQIFRNRLSSKCLSEFNASSCRIRCFSEKKEEHSPSVWEKYLLVWMKKYPSVAAVPKTVSSDTMKNTHDWARIKLNIIVCILTAVGCVFVVYSGKQAAKRGESVQKMNMKWHEEENKK